MVGQRRTQLAKYYDGRLTTVSGGGLGGSEDILLCFPPPLFNGPSLTPSAYAAESERAAAGDATKGASDCTHFKF